MVDAYTKSVLTVIAIALSIIAFRLAVPSASAALGEGCGDLRNPCFVAAAGVNGIQVEVTNAYEFGRYLGR